MANQFVISETGNGAMGNFISREVFQSYGSTIAEVVIWPDQKDLVLDGTSWNYSRTTLKYLHQFLRSHRFNFTTDEIRKKIESGEIKTANLDV